MDRVFGQRSQEAMAAPNGARKNEQSGPGPFAQ